MRLHAQTAMIENGFVHIPASAPWLAEYLHEMTVFPNGKHNDQVDSTARSLVRADSLRWRKADSSPWSPLHRRRLRDRPWRLVRIRVPAGQTNSFTGGTDGSNPLSSSGESCELRFRIGSGNTAPHGRYDARQGSMWVAVGHKRVSPIYNLVARGDAAARSIKRGWPPASTLCDPPVGAHCFRSRAWRSPPPARCPVDRRSLPPSGKTD